jgi:SAM-dependent methyltransferase
MKVKPITINSGKKWDDIYNNAIINTDPSSFSKFTIDKIENYDTLLDIGCGNARDTIFFNEKIKDITAIDSSNIVINQNILKNAKINFKCVDLQNINKLNKTYDNIYCRFVLHSIKKTVCDDLLINCFNILNKSGLFFIECRSINDLLYGEGERGSEENEFICGHYRRFIKNEELLICLKDIGFKIIYNDEAEHLSICESDDPSLIRIICKKI